MKNSLISLIIRTKNEERWISQCLSAIYNQTHTNFEVIVVDNESTDGTLSLISQFPQVKVLGCKDYLPGKALNIGVRESKGEYIVCLSGHCIPVNNHWLANLLRNFDSEKVAGVYGRQEPLAMTSDADKRDLLTVFGLDKRIQKKDSFFHNANSMLRRDLWEKYPFDEEITNIEDRIWAHHVLKDGYEIIYEPEASVYHYHGIHQNGDEQRCFNVVRIVENLISKDMIHKQTRDPQTMAVNALIPTRGEPLLVMGKSLLAITVEQAKASRYIKKVIVLTDNQKSAELARENGAEVPFLRDEFLSADYIDLEKVYAHSIGKLEGMGIDSDLIVTLEPTFPFRKEGLIDLMIERFLEGGYDSMLAVHEEHKSLWKKEEDGINRIDDGFTPRKYKDPTYLGLRGLCCLTRPDFLRQGFFYGSNVGLFEVDDPLAGLEIRTAKDLDLAEVLLNSHQQLKSGEEMV